MNPFLSSEKNVEKNIQDIKSEQCSSLHSKAFLRHRRHSAVMLKEKEKEKKVKDSEKIKNIVALFEKKINLGNNKEENELNEKINIEITPSNEILMMRNTFGKNNKKKKK